MTIATFSDRTATFPQTAATNAAGTAIIEAQHVGKTYRAERGKELTVLRDISFTLHEGEIVAILGRSGAGKSTFLRILAGLVPASSGTVTYRGTDITGPNPGVGLVFQTFALMPWLTVQANVELGLEARGVPREERRRAALQAIDAIGLDGFENAYPKELSGGMRQRVGIARALVVQPDALFMDEPFSALDVLTAENLRNEVLKDVERQSAFHQVGAHRDAQHRGGRADGGSCRGARLASRSSHRRRARHPAEAPRPSFRPVRGYGRHPVCDPDRAES